MRTYKRKTERGRPFLNEQQMRFLLTESLCGQSLLTEINLMNYSDSVRYSNREKMRSVDKKLSSAVLNKILNHLWYLNPENCLMALVDENVDTETKKNMIEKMFDVSDDVDELDLSDNSQIRNLKN
ncbi:unnamed protein product [Psylliodes chrysocephalus]|uniref:Uncharacterized protein n=1 Tax=Psylliodes chrysocephalus TaxID=3402493 RepID=A0A9P0CX22_9CUCU|nr:unnamed protein product [Psylliodes chrysocephala]